MRAGACHFCLLRASRRKEQLELRIIALQHLINTNVVSQAVTQQAFKYSGSRTCSLSSKRSFDICTLAFDLGGHSPNIRIKLLPI